VLYKFNNHKHQMHLPLYGLPGFTNMRAIEDHQALPGVPAKFSEPEQKSMLTSLSLARLFLTVKERV
jgi:hypothetical protein